MAKQNIQSTHLLDLHSTTDPQDAFSNHWFPLKDFVLIFNLICFLLDVYEFDIDFEDNEKLYFQLASKKILKYRSKHHNNSYNSDDDADDEEESEEESGKNLFFVKIMFCFNIIHNFNEQILKLIICCVNNHITKSTLSMSGF